MSNVTIESSGPCRRHLRIDIPAERVDREADAVVEAYLKMAKIPGFRPGKAPKAMVEKRYAKQVAQEVRERIVPEAYQQAIKEHDLRTVAVIDVDEPTVTRGQPFVFNVVLDVQPDFDMPAYEGITVEPKPVEVEDARIEEVLTSIRERSATFDDAEPGAAARAGDLVSIDTDATLDGQPLAEAVPELKELGSGKDFWLFAEDEQFLLPDLSNGLVGLKAGDETRIEVGFPERFPQDAVKGKTATFQVTVKAIRTKQVPELNEAMLKDLQVESEDQLRERIRADLLRMHEQEEARRQRNEYIRQLLELVNMDLPESVVQQETSRTVYDIVSENARRGVSNDDIEANRDQIFQAANRSAEDKVKLKYILLKIAEKEAVEVGDDEVHDRIRQLAMKSGRDPGKLKAEFLQEDGRGFIRLKEQLLMDKTLDAVMKPAAATAS